MENKNSVQRYSAVAVASNRLHIHLSTLVQTKGRCADGFVVDISNVVTAAIIN